MKTYVITLSYGSHVVGEFAVFANNIKEARDKAKTEKRLYILYDKPAGMNPNRIKATAKYIAKNRDYGYY